LNAGDGKIKKLYFGFCTIHLSLIKITNMIKKKKTNFLMKTILILTIQLACFSAVRSFAAPVPAPSDSVFNIMKKVADWQWHNLETQGWKTPKTDWTNGAMYAGMMSWAKIANDSSYYQKLLNVGRDNDWKIGPERHFADDYCVGQTYSQLYELYHNPEFIKDFRKLADTLVTISHKESLLWVNEIYLREWAWCDALFMGPPALGYLSQATGDPRYLNKASELWWKSSEYLYDKKEHLFYRDSRYFDKKEKNGAKVFWSRGNGWVMGGLVRLLEVMPANHPDRDRFVKQFKQMAAKVSSLQQADGSWHASLLDPASFPVKETSGTGFFIYALAWGVNHGLLSYKNYYPIIAKGWNALTSSVHPDGKLGFVQAQGRDPQNVTYEDTDVYGVGAFLLAGSELLQIDLDHQKGQLLVKVTNATPLPREASTIEVPWNSIKRKLKGVNAKNIIALNAITGQEIPSQVIYDGKKDPQSLIFQADAQGGTTMYFSVKKGQPSDYTKKTYGRKVPERYDDFAWENDKIAFRMYAAALDTSPDNAKGIDLWLKKTSNLVIDKWYKLNNYHIDHGEGLDAYSVGISLGSGNSAPITDKGLVFSDNYNDYKILDQGPLRISFQLIYKPWQVNGKKVEQIKTISLDAGSNLNKVKDEYKFEGNSLTIAAGITKHKDDGNPVIDSSSRFISYWDQSDGKVDNGKVGVGLIVPGYEKVVFKNELGHLLAISTLIPNETFVYYQGGAWNRSGFFPNEQSWINYLKNFSMSVQKPLEVSYK
jgi:unsaturated rhamnogalacturonyl hydrolase